MKDKITVIIPCYNAEKHIDRCLKSIEDQTYGINNMEIILVDDASEDDTYEHLLRFERKYPDNTAVIACEENGGPGSARNTGMEYATGKYISFVDSDDMVDITMLQRMQAVAECYDPDVTECSYRLFWDIEDVVPEKKGSDYFVRVHTAKERRRLILNSFKSAAWGCLYKKSFLEDNRLCFSDGILYGEDCCFSGLAMLTCESYYYMGDTLYFYYNNMDGIMSRNADNERIRQLGQVMISYINELYKRGFLDGPLDECGRELEWYMIYKYFLDPARFLLSRKNPGWQEQIRHFRKGILEVFPQAYNNVYLSGDKRWEAYVDLLKGE